MTTTANLPSPHTSRFWYIPIIAVLLALAALTWANFRFVEHNPGGKDFLVHWSGTRAFIFEGQSPYSEETAAEIRRIAKEEGIQAGDHELRVIYPFYSVLIFAPFSLVGDYTLARSLWMSVLEVAIVAIGILSIQLVGWRVKFWLVPFYLVFAFFWYHGLRALINGNAIVIVTLFIVGALMAIRKEQYPLAGMFLALATTMPHLVFMLILFILLWAVSHRRWSLIGWTFGWHFLLFLVGVLFIPNWLIQNIWAVLRFPDLCPTLTIGAVFETWVPGVGTQLKWGLSIVLILLLLLEWWRARRVGFNHFLWTTYLTLAINQWIGFITDPSVIFLLFPAVLLIFSIIQDRWHRVGVWIVLVILLLLVFGLWGLFTHTFDAGYQIDRYMLMFIPVPLFVFLGLYWSGWWAKRPNRLIFGS